MIMAIGTATPRDKLDKLLAFFQRSMRYWWLVAIIAVIGAVLVTLLAMKMPKKYVSEATVFYNERINSSLLQGRDVMQQTKNLGNQYRGFILARQQLAKVISKLDLLPQVVAKDGVEAAVEEMKKLVTFRVLGTNMFHIKFQAPDPEQAQAVTAMLIEILISEDRRIRRESANATKNFLVEQKAKHSLELEKATRALAMFLEEHPEFAESSAAPGQQLSGAGIRSSKDPKAQDVIPGAATMDPRLLVLERQRKRLKTRLEAPDDPGSRKPVDSPERQQALEDVRRAERDLDAAKRDLESKLTQLQPAHPDVRRAQSRVNEAERRVKRAKADVPPAGPAAAPIDRGALEKDLDKVDKLIAATKAQIRAEKKGRGAEEPEEVEGADTGDNWVVKLETEYVRLDREVNEARRRVSDADGKLNSAEITSEQQMADDSAVLTIIDPANRPAKSQGKPAIFLILAGTFVFIVLGSVLALALALVDDRIYTAGDLESLGIAPVMVVIPRAATKRRARRG